MTSGADPQRYFFVHVQKAAGTSMLARFRKHFSLEQIYPDQSDRVEDPSVPTLMVSHLRHRYAARRDEIRVVTGHFPMRTTEVLGDAFVTLTVLRDPVERTLSFLRHHQRMVPRDGDVSLEELYEDDIRFHGLIHNNMVKMFSLGPEEMTSGPGDGLMTRIEHFDDARLASAKANLERVDVIGFDDELETFCAELTSRFGWSLGPPVRANTTEPVSVPASFRARISADNAQDHALFEHAREIVSERRHDAGAGRR